MPHLFLFVSVVSLLGSLNVWRPLRSPSALAGLSFFAGWLTGELPLHHVATQMLLTLAFVYGGALDSVVGRVALALALLSWTLLLLFHRRSYGAREVLDRALRDALGDDYEDELTASFRGKEPSAIEWDQVLAPFPIRRREVERIADVEYHQEGKLHLKLDVYRQRARPTGSPALVYVHGGGWVMGRKTEQGLPFMQLLAAQGWTCFAIDYRLSPRATFPDALVDVKRAIAWVRAHGSEYGAAGDFVVLSGNSAGGHLAALAALTADRPEFQPGFESARTHVDGCLPFYGIYDFTDRFGHWENRGLERLLERYVMKVRRADVPEVFDRASPITHIHDGAPPFFLIHGASDTLVPVAEARRFHAALASRLTVPIGYAELPNAQHAFDVFPSVRTLYVVAGATRFAEILWRRHLAARSPIDAKAIEPAAAEG